jgi:hypothetical protein
MFVASAPDMSIGVRDGQDMSQEWGGGGREMRIDYWWES